jgi:hypothetical protein
MPLSKKDVERHYFDRFQALCQPFPEGSITSTEEPDFLVAGPKRTIGVELTELHREASPGRAPLQATEAMRHRVAARAQEIYEQGSHPPVRCTIFLTDTHIEKSQVEPVAKAISDIALRNIPLPNASTNESYDWVNRSYFPEVIDSISVHRLDAITQTHFNCPGATMVPKLSRLDIERTLAAKEAKYSAYRQRCDEAWLLVNADIGSMSTWFDFNSNAIAGPFATSFDRVFIMRHLGQALHELALSKPSEG